LQFQILLVLVAIERNPQSSYELAGTLKTSRPTVVRLVEDLRELGCNIEAVREGKTDWAYHLHDWGVFAPARVRTYLKDSGHIAPTGSAP
jgi:predicted transcriptional regulator